MFNLLVPGSSSSGTTTSQTANTVYAGPTSGGVATPTFRVLVDADIPSSIARLDAPAFTGKLTHSVTLVAGETGFRSTITPPSSGGGSENLKGFEVFMSSGYQGSNTVKTASFINLSKVTGFDLGGPYAGMAVRAATYADLDQANNVGLVGDVGQGLRNYGVVGYATTPRGSISKDVGVVGLAETGGAFYVGVYGKIGSSIGTSTPAASAAALFDNGASGSPITIFQANGSTVAQVTSTGIIYSTVGMRTLLSTADVSNPPTNAQMVSALGAAATTGSGYFVFVDDNAGHTNEYLVFSDGTKYWQITATACA